MKPSRATVAYGLIGAFLACLIALSWGYTQVQTQRTLDHRLQRATLEASVQTLERHFSDLLTDMKRQAALVATQPFVVKCLREVTSGDHIEHLSQGQKEAITYFKSLPQTDERTAIELYDLRYDLLAWSGISLALDPNLQFRNPATAAPFSLPKNPEIRVYTAPEDGLQALELWHPVYFGANALGAIRVVRLVHVPTSARKSALAAYQIEDEWKTVVQLPVTVDWRRNQDRAENPAQGVGLLKADDGQVLGRLRIFALSDQALMEDQQTRLADLNAFWQLLGCLWLFGGIWAWHRHLMDKKGLWAKGSALGLLGLAWLGLRAVLLGLELPERWLKPYEWAEVLFNPRYLASTFGWGAARSIGDLLISGLFLLGLAIYAAWRLHLWVQAEGGTFADWGKRFKEPPPKSSWLRFILGWLGLVVLLKALWIFQTELLQHAVFDSVLDYLAWSGLMPRLPVLMVFCAFILSTVSVWVLGIVLLTSGFALLFSYRPALRYPFLVGLLILAGGWLLLAGGWDEDWHIFSDSGLFFISFVFIGFSYLKRFHEEPTRLFTLRALLVILVVATGLLYPRLYKAIHDQLRQQMQEVAHSFAEGEEDRILETISYALADAQRGTEVLYMQGGEARYDSTFAHEVLGRLTADLNDLGQGSFEATYAVFDAIGQPVLTLRKGSATDSERSSLTQTVQADFPRLKQDFEAAGRPEQPIVKPVTRQQGQEQFQYEGLSVLGNGQAPRAWILIRVEQRVRYAGENLFARPSIEAIQTDAWRRKLSVAEYENGILKRGQGGNFSRSRLSDDVLKALETQDMYWKQETVYGQTYDTYYRNPLLPNSPVHSNKIIAVRAPAPMAYDHLYYILRITVSGLWLLLLVYGLGAILRYRRKEFPAPRGQFRDKILNAFMAVGIVAVLAMGIVGQQVLMRENQNSIQSRLERRLERSAETLQINAAPEALPWQSLEAILKRGKLDSLATALSLDLHIFRASELVRTTRPELIRERIIPTRLPIEAYEQLYLQTLRNAYVANKGEKEARYTIGYKALPDIQGVPRYVMAVIMLQEQDRVQEEQARTTAYLFGALLFLLMLIMTTATIVANALTRPLSSLRAGLQAVAGGRFDQTLPVTTRDEVGELVATFNEMQVQLAESREQLSLQERKLAWNEMARQVAHEIKNPLTPMKLSVQHLQRAYQNFDPQDEEGQERFRNMFKRITTTLTEQIDALTRIANSFSTFARMPKRVLTQLDLNQVVEEALAVVQLEEGIQTETNWHEAALPIHADREELRRIFLNVFKNGIQAMPNGGILSIRTGLEGDESGKAWAVAYVRDTGIGIPIDIQAKIFQPNFSTKTSGMGLGLAIVKKTIEDLRGSIDFETQEGQGTQFKICLPIQTESPDLGETA